jgi:hypothetical protein
MKHCVCRRSASPRLIVVVRDDLEKLSGRGRRIRSAINPGGLSGSDKAKLGRARVARTVSHVVVAELEALGFKYVSRAQRSTQ